MQLEESAKASAGYDAYVGRQSPDASYAAESHKTEGVRLQLSQILDKGIGWRREGETSIGYRRAPLIIYASRTHSQLHQVIGELRKTSYRPKIAVVGSREQQCANPSVRKLKSNGAMAAVCQQLVKKNTCSDDEQQVCSQLPETSYSIL